MAEHEPRNALPGDDDELSIEELENVSGGLADDTNGSCPNTNCSDPCGNTNCTSGCSAKEILA